MRLFWELCKRSFQRHLTYRAAALAGLATNFIFGLLRMAVFLALYGDRADVGGLTVAGVITYSALTQAVIAYLSLFGWFELANSVYTGEIAADLLKPMSLFTIWLARDLGRAALNLLLRGVAIVLLYALVLDLVYPTSLTHWLALLISIVLSWLVSFAWRFTINLAAFWTPDALGVARFFFALSWFLSGFLMPLRFYPAWLQNLAAWTPFPAMINTVVELYLGMLAGNALWQALLLQLAWGVALVLASQLILRAGIRRLVILGG